MNGVDAQASLTPIAGTRSDVIGALQAHLGNERQDAETWYSLGLALLNEGRHEEAAAALHAALTLSPHNIGIEGVYAAALGGLGATGEAAELLEDVIHRSPGDGWAYFHLAAVRYRQGDCEQAAQLWEAAARLADDPMDCLENVAMVRRRLGEVEGERRCWQRAAKHDPANPIVLHMLAAVGLRPMPPRADGAYVACMFDRFAPDFDRVLAQLQYRVPDLCEQWMRDQFGPPGRRLRVLDAGCGTGLCGERLRPWAAGLVGVDLSARMLEHAARRGVYERLERADLVEFLHANPGGFDVVVAGDVLCYFGDLGLFAQSALASLRAEGLLGFSVERAGTDELGDRRESGYIIRHHGRYAHTCRHIKHAFRGARLRLAEVVLRLELGEAVGGYWVSAKRKGHGRTAGMRIPTTSAAEP
jgi:predicted TPR repeat methyltransferase